MPVPPACKWKHLAGQKLADPKFDIPVVVDILLGADVFEKLMQLACIIGERGTPRAMQMVLRWIPTGQTDDTMHSTSLATLLVQCILDDVLQRSGTVEDVPGRKLLT
jgi:hypothetical protein